MPLLKVRTRSHHDRVEALVPVMSASLTLPQYARVVAAMYGFYLPLEARLAELDVPASFELSRRAKVSALERDLMQLGETRPPIARAKDLPVLEGTAHALGSLYVLEGATLGGQVIGRHLRRHLDLDVYSGAAFFGSYGQEVGRMWQGFSRELTSFVSGCGGADDVVEGAVRTFDALEGWLARALAQRCSA